MNEYQIKLEINKIMNGGAGSGNHNPGQGRGVGKPGNGSKSSGTSKTSKEAGKERIEKFSAKWKEKGLDKPASSIPELEKQVEDAKKLYKEFEKEYNPANADELAASFRVEKTIKEKEETLGRLREEHLISEPSEEIREKAREAIIEIDVEYDDPSEHAYELVERADSIKQLRDILRREYGGSLSDSDIDKILEIE